MSVKICQKFQGPFGPLASKKIEVLNFFFWVRFGLSNILYTSDIEMNPHYQVPFGPLVLTSCGTSGWYLSKFWGQLAQGSTLFWPCLLVVPLNSSPLLLHPTPYRHAAELSHGLGSSPTQQAAVQSFLQNYSKAIEILVNTAKVQPSAQLYILLGKTQIKAKKYREAVESLEKALDYMVCWFDFIFFGDILGEINIPYFRWDWKNKQDQTSIS